MAQRDLALRKAQFVRSQRAEMKRAIKDGSVDPWALLRGGDSKWEGIVREMRLDRILDAIPGIGEVTRNEALLEFRLLPHTRLMALTYERRAELAAALQQALAGEPVPPSPEPLEAA